MPAWSRSLSLGCAPLSIEAAGGKNEKKPSWLAADVGAEAAAAAPHSLGLGLGDGGARGKGKKTVGAKRGSARGFLWTNSVQGAGLLKSQKRLVNSPCAWLTHPIRPTTRVSEQSRAGHNEVKHSEKEQTGPGGHESTNNTE
jgi:hypothetical protein